VSFLEIGQAVSDGRPFRIDTEAILTKRTCIIAAARSGKSNLVRQICGGLVGMAGRSPSRRFLVLDSEQDYAGLRRANRMIRIADDERLCDIEWDNPRLDKTRLGMLAPKSWPLILDVTKKRYDEERRKSINAFMDGLFEEERKLKLPYLVVIDEADVFVGKNATGGGIKHINDFTLRDLKNKLGLLICTHSPSLLPAGVIGSCDNYIIGRMETKKLANQTRDLFEEGYEGLARFLPTFDRGEFFAWGFNGRRDPQRIKAYQWKHGTKSPTKNRRMANERSAEVAKLLEGPSYGVRAAIVLAGGKGLRMSPTRTPKALIKIHRKSIIFWILKWLKGNGIRTVVVGVAYRKEDLVPYLINNDEIKALDLEVIPNTHLLEDETGGAFRKAIRNHLKREEDFVAMNGDELTTVNLRKMIGFHLRKKPLATLAVARMQSPYGVVGFGKDYLAKSFEEKPILDRRGAPWVSTGVYVFNRKILRHLPRRGSVEQETFGELAQRRYLRAYPLSRNERWVTINTLKDLDIARDEMVDWGWVS
jgi:dTDP-glucose pyrophosphorylase